MTYNIEYSRDYYKKHKMDYARRSREWRKKNPSKVKESRQRQKRTVKGWLTKVYSCMKKSSKKRTMPMPSFTKEDLSKWLDDNYKEQFDVLFHNWIKNECLKDLTPSINRLNDYKPYTLDNLELVIWKTNNQNGRTSSKVVNEVHNKLGDIAKIMFSRKVVQKDMLGNVLRIYPSLREAERQNEGFCASTISKVCRGIKHTHKGYGWEYNETKNESR